MDVEQSVDHILQFNSLSSAKLSSFNQIHLFRYFDLKQKKTKNCGKRLKTLTTQP